MIRQKLVRKTLDMIKKIADEKYNDTFWKEFGTNIKLGVIEDHSNRTRLAKLLRFQSSLVLAYLQNIKGCGRQVFWFSEKLKHHMLSPEVPHCLEQTEMGSRRLDNICMDIWGLVDEGLIGANSKCTSQKCFSLENP